MVNRVAVATTAALLIFAAPAAASTAAGPSPTPLILELILAVVVMTGMAVRRPIARAAASVRGKLTRPRPTRRALEPRA